MLRHSFQLVFSNDSFIAQHFKTKILRELGTNQGLKKMDSSMQKKTSSIIVSLLIGILIISFMFTGYESISGSPDSVGKVGPYKIKIEEYQRAINQQMQFYQQVFKDQKMSNTQMESIKQSTFSSLINSKLSLILADKVGILPGGAEVKEFIRNQEYFKTDGQFDKNKYFAILANVGIPPKDYEEDMAQSIKLQSLQTVFANYPISKSYLADLKTLKEQSKVVTILMLDPTQLEKHIDVSEAEIATYLADENNSKKVQSVFDSKKSSLSIEEQVHANHILLNADEENASEIQKKADALMKQLNNSNFKELADKNTEDPSGKGQGGSLGWFGRGSMVPEFDKAVFAAKPGSIIGPVRTEFGFHLIQILEKKEGKVAIFDNFKHSLAKELIQKSKRNELAKLEAQLINEARGHSEKNNSTALANLASKYSLKIEKDKTINPIDDFTQLGLNAEQISQIFFSENKSSYEFKDGTKTVLVSINTQAKASVAKVEDEFEKELASSYARELNQKFLEQLKDDTNIKQNKRIQL